MEELQELTEVFDEVVERAVGVHQINHIAVAINVNHGPELAPGVDSGEENTLLLIVYSQHYITTRLHVNVIIHHTFTVREILGKGFNPESDGSGPIFGFLNEPNVDLFVDSDGSVTEYDAF